MVVEGQGAFLVFTSANTAASVVAGGVCKMAAVLNKRNVLAVGADAFSTANVVVGGVGTPLVGSVREPGIKLGI